MLVSAGDQPPSLSFGECLRRERELRRISLRDVSEATKINIRYLEALERNDFTFLPAGAFTRGFIRSYARYIGTDENEMINAYLYELGVQEKERKVLGGRDAAHVGSSPRRARSRTGLSRRLLVALALVALLALAAAAILFGPRLLGGVWPFAASPPAGASTSGRG
jgi:cytoskeletal protein RodZ